ncbi:MAG: hypothetical protein ACK5NC_08765 [Vibrio sp.]
MQLTESTLSILLEEAIIELNQMDIAFLYKNQADKFEVVLFDILNTCITKLGYLNVERVELVSGQKFPDLVIHTDSEKLGIEVKTARKDWVTLGGSIFESTRVAGVEVIYVFFAQFSDNQFPLFRYANLHNCIEDVVITHKPRYRINMDLDETLFSKAGVNYNDIRTAKRPFSLLRNYLKNKNGQKSDLWWVDDGESEASGPQAIVMWDDVESGDKERLIRIMYALFPELLSTHRDKYVQAGLFLISKHGILCRSLRDIFTAGGTYDFYGSSVPKYIQHVSTQNDVDAIRNQLTQLPYELVADYWGDFRDEERTQIWSKHCINTIQSNNNICETAQGILITFFQNRPRQ